MLANAKALLSVTLAFFLAVCVFALAASTQQGTKKAARTTITGCLQKGDEADEFAITGENGKNYELVSRTVKLAEHVGHKVSVTGTLIGEESEEKEEQEAGEGWVGRMQVTSLKMVSEACK
jgi:hypothetical protein